MIRSGEGTDFGPAAEPPTRRRAALGLMAGALLAPSPAPASAQASPPGSSAPSPNPSSSPPSAPPSEGQSQGGSDTLKSGRDSSDRMTVPVMLNGKGPFAFVVDSGASQSGLSAELASQLQLPAGQMVRVHGIVAAFLTSSVNVEDFRVGSIQTSLHNAPTFARADLGADGLIGLDVLHDRVLTLDFLRNRIEVARHSFGGSAFRTISGAASTEVVVPARQRFGQLTIIDAQAGRAAMTCFIDTGADRSVGNNALRIAVEARMNPRDVINIDVVIRSVTGQNMPAVVGLVPSMRIGGVGFTRFGLAFADLHTFDIWGLTDKPALLVGMDLLQLFHSVAIDFGEREVTFTPK